MPVDIVLRAPLDGLNEGTSSSNNETHKETTRRRQRHHDDFVRSSISGLLVGASVLKLSVETRFTAAALLHRYYIATGIPECKSTVTAATATAHLTMTNSPLDSRDRSDEAKYVVAACLLLASKREEEPRRLRDLVNVVRMIDWSDGADHVDTNTSNKSPAPCVTNGDASHTHSTDSTPIQSIPTTTITWQTTPPALDAVYWNSKQRLVQTERRVLLYLSFDVTVSRPHRAVALLLQDTDAIHALWQALSNQSGSLVGATNPPTPSSTVATWFHSALRVLNGTVYSSDALHHAILPMAVACIIVAATDGTVVPNVTSTEPRNARVTALVATQRWSLVVPVSVNEVTAAVESLQRLYYNADSSC